MLGEALHYLMLGEALHYLMLGEALYYLNVEKAEAEGGSGKYTDYGLEHQQGKEAGSIVNPTELKKRNKIKDKERLNVKEAVQKASACISVFIPKSDIIKILTVGNLILGKFLSSLDQKLLQLKVPAYLRCTLNRKKGEKATIGAHIKPNCQQYKNRDLGKS